MSQRRAYRVKVYDDEGKRPGSKLAGLRSVWRAGCDAGMVAP